MRKKPRFRIRLGLFRIADFGLMYWIDRGWYGGEDGWMDGDMGLSEGGRAWRWLLIMEGSHYRGDSCGCVRAFYCLTIASLIRDD